VVVVQSLWSLNLGDPVGWTLCWRPTARHRNSALVLAVQPWANSGEASGADIGTMFGSVFDTMAKHRYVTFRELKEAAFFSALTGS
jgi:hypothetical protein